MEDFFVGQREATVCEICGEDRWDSREFHVCYSGKELREAMIARFKEYYLKTQWNKGPKKWVYKHKGD